MADDADVLPFTARAGISPKPAASPGEVEPDGERVDAGKAFATVTGQRSAATLEFIRRDGSSFSMPYSYAPLLWWNPPGSLVIEYPGFFSVLLRGFHLAELHRRLRDRKVTWICETGEIGTADAAAVTTLEIVRLFPSRDEADNPEAG